ncbi:3-hydroxybutyryl-CoA dehydrogenase [Cryobacterium mesophilum]|uniref:3-hydroxyacyl-CoA dehydrogenase family protein n=1 Tax=Terrimesophilobacter mesophilus TaxID=433647 RepID=A0A4R8V8S8_9MICO|nr:3-hydroxyacyl-CoA dehydrogenase family protein [Terrimesophilobacter mesophilus]MBB5632734.1 3-hydroxybutyryl-CoA dehydrogenase [Terrimesophilobacter mesophilus]TFB79534.1 3-hydroxyacyl-CoA dehydrogenase family protein [Terrimesophilobacter mesophilus]
MRSTEKSTEETIDPLSVAVIGGGIMGRGIALALATAGHAVSVVESDTAAADALAERIEAAALATPELSPESRLAALSRVVLAPELEAAVASADLVIEAVPEQLAIKEPIWTRLGQSSSPTAILATNTSALDIDAIAARVPHRERVIGTHWFNPANVIPCVEVVRGAETSQTVVDAVVELLARAGKQPVVVKNSPGFVANRIQFALVREALLCLEEGLATAEDIDAIVSSSFGMRLAVLGPLAHADFGGLGTYRSILDFLTGQLGERFSTPAILDRLVSEGRLGVSTGAGISEYDAVRARELTAYRDSTLRRVLAAVQAEDKPAP